MSKITYAKIQEDNGTYTVFKHSPHIIGLKSGDLWSITIYEKNLTEKEADTLINKLTKEEK